MSIFQKFFGSGSTDSSSELTETKVKDPTCGMEIDPKSAVATAERDGETYYFCSENCKSKFVGGGKDNNVSGTCC